MTKRLRIRRAGLALVTHALLSGVLLVACAGQSSPQPGGEDGAPAISPSDRATDAAPSTEVQPTRGFTLAASGDILLHDSLIEQARTDAGGSGYDFRPMLREARSVIRDADVALCHMETVYGAPRGPFTGYPTFRSPPQIAEAVRDTGYHSCSTASNHSLDAGRAGVTRTLDAMDAAGLRHVGSARSAAERASPPLLSAGDATVAHLSYTYGTNVGVDSRGVPLDAARPWLVNRLDTEQVIADADAARRAGADVVVASVHWGTEWQERPDAQQLRMASELTSARIDGRRAIDLILGTHAHVPQAYEKVNGTWVVYGMGDQLAGEMSDPRGSMGTTARFRFEPPAREGGEWTVRAAEFVPHLVVSEPRFRMVNLPEAMRREPGETTYLKARNLISRAVLSRGAAKDGLREGR